MKLTDRSLCISLCLCLIVLTSVSSIAQEQAIPGSSSAGILYFIRNNNIWTFDLKTAQELQITHDKKVTSYSVSHSGRQLAYFVDAEKLYIYDLVNNKEDLIAQIKTDETNPSFSPKGDKLVLIGYSAVPVKNTIHFLSNTYGQHVRHVWLLDIKSKKLTDLMPESQYLHMFASWSPDGKLISYASFVDPWWTMFKNTEWEVDVMDVNDNNRLSYKIGKGYRSQWIDNNRLAALYDRSLKVYDIQTKQVIKEFTFDDACDADSSFSIGKAMNVLFYTSFCGREERKTGLIMFDPTSQKKREIIYDADNPTYVE